jgi:hypothetical protein
MEVNASGKHTSLLGYGNNNCRKSFILQAPGFNDKVVHSKKLSPGACTVKLFTAIIITV